MLTVHLLKWIFQPTARSSGWKGTIIEQRTQLNAEFEDSKNLWMHGKSNFAKVYQKAREIASAETELPLSSFPEEQPFSFEETVDEKYLPE